MHGAQILAMAVAPDRTSVGVEPSGCVWVGMRGAVLDGALTVAVAPDWRTRLNPADFGQALALATADAVQRRTEAWAEQLASAPPFKPGLGGPAPGSPWSAPPSDAGSPGSPWSVSPPDAGSPGSASPPDAGSPRSASPPDAGSPWSTPWSPPPPGAGAGSTLRAADDLDALVRLVLDAYDDLDTVVAEIDQAIAGPTHGRSDDGRIGVVVRLGAVTEVRIDQRWLAFAGAEAIAEHAGQALREAFGAAERAITGPLRRTAALRSLRTITALG